MRKTVLFSKSWCDLVFQGRNKDYGAYKIRSGTGRRYRFALLIVILFAIAACGLPMCFSLYLRYKVFDSFKDVTSEVRELKRLEKEKPYETKLISAGRAAPKVTTNKEAIDDTPEIVESTENNIIIGIKGDETITAAAETEMIDRDTLHHKAEKDLPIEGVQISAVDVVREMPQFPGGIPGLMAWLEANILYPRSCIKKKIEGDVHVTFVIDISGMVQEPTIAQSLHPELDSVAIRAIRNMPKWKKPGYRNGQKTAVSITLPIHFQVK